jgi:hypothetical protein
MSKKKDHVVQVIVAEDRYVAVELNGVVSISRNGDHIGKARWRDDQLVDSSAVLPDAAYQELERKIGEGIANNWGED